MAEAKGLLWPYLRINKRHTSKRDDRQWPQKPAQGFHPIKDESPAWIIILRNVEASKDRDSPLRHMFAEWRRAGDVHAV
ncbi:hypothetical protein EVAR_32915_1 [Eumeta japonica]|uniref:Uncharacterized protein n=1 Tax=Eumeta variegata TaxID=151549 RepID=A0A4C2A0H3_EUMVA|nr:hypothetical protein EVAR_32915_1 [Eumeta japonica]